MTIPIITGSPGVYLREEDVSQQDLPISTSIASMVFASPQGSLSPKLITSPTQFQRRYGKGDVSVGFGHVSAQGFFGSTGKNNTQPAAMWALRVVNTDARYAGATVLTTGPAGTPPGDVNEGISYIQPLVNGTGNGYGGGGQQLFLLSFTVALATGASLSGVITPGSGSPVNYGPITYATSPAATLAAIITALNSALASIPPAANSAEGVATLVQGNPSNNEILIWGPEGTTINSITATLTGQSGNTATVSTPNKLFDVFAENPGEWANDVGINISNVNTGIKQRSQLTFSSAIVTGNTINLSLLVNNATVVIPQVLYNTSNDATLTALATAIQTAIPNSQVSAIIPTGSTGASARQINIIAPNPGPGVIGFYSGNITGGASQARMAFAETYAGVVGNNTFTLNVWNRGNIVIPAASYVVALSQQLNGQGQQLFIEQVVNLAAGASILIRVQVDAANIALGADIDPNAAATLSTIVWLNGGVDGSLPTNSQIIAGWQTFTAVETYNINLLINAGYTDVNVQQAMAVVVENRQDSMGIFDFPSAFQDTQDAANYRQTQLNIDTSYAAIYTPDVQITDSNTNQQILVPPSGFVAGRYVYTDNRFATWWAPAGNDRGQLNQVNGVRVVYEKADRDVLDPLQINCIKLARDGSGWVIWGDNTLQVTPSLLSAVNVRRLMLYIENTIVRSLERNVFDNTSSQLAFLITQRLNSFLRTVQNNQGIRNFLVLANSSNNPGYFADAGQLNITIYCVPTRAAKTILLDAVVTPSTVSFSELIVNGIF